MVRWREPAAWVMLAAVTLQLAEAITYLVRDRLDSGASRWVLPTQLLVVDPVLVAVLGALVGLCAWWQPIRRARALSVLALTVTVAATVLSLGLALRAIFGRAGEVSALPHLLSELAVPGVVIFAVLKMVAATAQGRAARRSDSEDSGVDAVHPPAIDTSATALVDPQQQPTWQPDEAQGTAWHRAGDAARGGAGSGWQVEDSTGWTPMPAPPAQPALGSAIDQPEREPNER